ncbi:MAG: ion transporter [Myxococcota bacterium]|nr:ion transporter [Myxococcota bacterium]
MSSRYRQVRRRVHQILEVAEEGDATSRAVDLALMTLVAVNIAAVVLESLDSVQASYGTAFRRLEIISVAVFSVEYVARFWSAAEEDPQVEPWRNRLRYVRSPMAVADLASIAPLFLSAFTSADLRFLRVLRLLRILKLTRYSSALGTIVQVVRSEGQTFGTAFLLLLSMLIFASSGIYLAEHRAQPEAFGSIPHAMWWAVSALTTVGYGDLTPITPVGKIFASLVTVVGVGVVALPTSIMASGFAQISDRNRRRLQSEAEQAFEDGYFSASEAARYEQLAAELGVPADFAREIAEAAARRHPLALANGPCPHCGKEPDEAP